MKKLDVRAKEWDNVRALTFEVRMETSGQIPGIPEADGELIPESSVRTESRFAIAFAEYAREKDPKKEKEKLYDLARAYYLWVPLESVILDMGRKGGTRVLPPVLSVLRRKGSLALFERIVNDFWMRNPSLSKRYDGFRLVAKSETDRREISFERSDSEIFMTVKHLSRTGSAIFDRFEILTNATVRFVRSESQDSETGETLDLGSLSWVFDPEAPLEVFWTEVSGAVKKMFVR
jgi:hypothetical protein